MMTWKLSAGTACAIGKKRIKSDVPSTTAYIMLGEKCRNHCAFCTQASNSSANENLLSRVTWPAFVADDIVPDIAESVERRDLKRVCLQVVDTKDSWKNTIDSLKKLTQNGRKPICVSSHIDSLAHAKTLLATGAERICIALDAATPELYGQVKGGDWEKQWLLLTECAKALPGSVTTHLIVGLGETEEEMVDRMAACVDRNITVGLFAFTPVQGTTFAEKNPPALGQYRRIQMARHLLCQGVNRRAICCTDGIITDFTLPNWRTLCADGKAFETTGCPDCNRPYYNERPGGILYNYPRPLTKQESLQALRESQIGGGDNVLACP